MLSNEIIQNCIDDIGQIMQAEIHVFGNDGIIVAQYQGTSPELKDDVESFLESSQDYQQMKEYHFFKIYDGEEVAYIVVSGGDLSEGNLAESQKKSNFNAGNLVVRQISRLMEAYKEKLNSNQFIQNLLLDHLIGTDIFNQSKMLGIEAAVSRTVFVIETEHEQDEVVWEMIRELYGKNNYDFVTAVDDRNIILVKELRGESLDENSDADNKEEAESIANMLVDMVNVETMSKVRVGYSNPAADIKEVSKAYREAKMAVEVGKIFYSDKTIVAYNMLGIGRLIYQLPPELCDMFLEEVFGGVMPDKFDEETLATINKFFELNLNLSETARQLYIHRNTLAYRLERIEKMTGLDIRSFEDAMTFKLALMVADYRRMTGKEE